MRPRQFAASAVLGRHLPTVEERLDARTVVAGFLASLASFGCQVGAAARGGAAEIRDLAEHLRRLPRATRTRWRGRKI